MSQALGPSHDAARFRAHNHVAVALVIMAVLALGARLLLVQVLRGDRYEKYAAIERVTKVRAQAPRGIMQSSDGTVLARNIESHRLEVLTNRVTPARIPQIINTLRALLDLTDSEVAHVSQELSKEVDPRKRRPLVVRRDLVSTHCPYDSSPLHLVDPHSYGFCSACGRYLEPVPERKTCPFDQRRLVPVDGGKAWHCNSCDRDFSNAKVCPYDGHEVAHGQHILQCPLCQRTFNDEVAVLRANLHHLPEGRVMAEVQREYPLRFLASHVLGYMGYVLEQERTGQVLPWGPPRFGLNDRVGRTGLERSLDNILRGVDGEQVLVRKGGSEEQAKDLDDLVAALKPQPAIAGPTLILTLDSELQRAAKTAMKDVYSGAVAVVDVHTGAIRALYSKPSFDPNTMSGKRTPGSKSTPDGAAYAPLINKALHAFPPASTYKIVTAVAGLEEGDVRIDTAMTCPGHYDYGGRRFHCHERRGHGEVDIHTALKVSCDVYFYRLGEALGIDRMEVWARHLGFGEHTGIELPESVGRIPTRVWYRDHVPGGYYPGFALSTAVGQKDVLTTPLQLARIYAGIATGGVLPNLTLIERFEDESGRSLVPDRAPPRRYELKPSTWRMLRQALRAVVNEDRGTAASSKPKTTLLAGKTGTAQAPQRVRKAIAEKLREEPGALARLTAWLQNDHAWFVGYAPADQPEVAIVVFLEHGGSGGHHAAPIARQILDVWGNRRGTMQESAGSSGKKRRPARSGLDQEDNPEDPASQRTAAPATGVGPDAPASQPADTANPDPDSPSKEGAPHDPEHNPSADPDSDPDHAPPAADRPAEETP